ncbi:MAG TPA: MFS transporter [Candidatus Bathyarchaeia archaeon]|nr:MFS transporter [Candidatus Bathyarchaeia archaeon]
MSSTSASSQRAILAPTQLVPPIQTTRTALFVIGGALLALVLGVMDQSIVVTAGPAIIHALPGGLGLYPWVFTAFILAQTVSMPILGKLSDMYGRKRFFLAGLVLFMAGSILSGASQTIQQLVIFRAIQGVGSGAFFSIGLAIIGTSVTPERRARVLGLSGSVLGSGAIFGPTAGSYLVQSVGWRWIFYVNIPLGLAALAIIGIALRETRLQVMDRSIDSFGVATLSGWVSLLLLGLLNGGTTYPWFSWQEAVFLAGFAILLPLFVWVESRARNPILPLSLFRNRTISASVATQLVRGMVFYGGVVYVSLFIQGALGGTIDDVRNIVYSFVVPFIIGSIVSGRVVNRFGYRAVTMSGLLIVTLGALLRVLVGISPSLVEVAIASLPLGLGLGVTLASVLSAFQNSVDQTRIGTASSLSTFSQNLGGAVGVGIIGTIQLNSLSSRLAALVQQAPFQYQGKLAELFANPNQVGFVLSSSTGLSGSPLASFLPQIRTALAGSVLDASIGLLVMSIIAVVASSFVPGRPKKPSLSHAR